MTDMVNHPAHYNLHPSGVECIEMTKYMPFCVGNAYKYVWRHREKGNAVQDLDKAIFYIEEEKKISLAPTYPLPPEQHQLALSVYAVEGNLWVANCLMMLAQYAYGWDTANVANQLPGALRMVRHLRAHTR